ncbi:MAG: aminotransferase class V-fold PLP-dependent enzyme [Anaerolineaceae bacterium]|nr:aminotransferase class V-fold PLP-dependent enzyme [Anaerolineaceae bacterium]
MNSDIRSLFPVTQECIYLDTAYTAPIPTPCMKASFEFTELRSRGKAGRVDDWIKEMDRAKINLALLINAHPDEIVLTTNTSEGTNIVASSLQINKPDNIIWDDLEYNSNKLVWLNLQQKNNIENRIVRSNQGAIRFEDYEKVVDENTRVISLSLVAHNGGYRYDARQMADLAHENGAYLHVDACQAVGAFKIDVKEDEIDFLTCGAYKWLLGPTGLAFLYIREGLIPKLEPIYRGWMQVKEWSQDPEKIADILFETAQKFQTGTIHFQGIYELNAALNFIQEVGLDQIEKHNFALSRKLWNMLNEIGMEMYTPEGTMSSIVTCMTPPNMDAGRFLAENNIIVTSREGLIRFSPHLFNIDAEIEHAVEVLKRCL